MLIPFALDSEALEDKFESNADRIAAHRRMVRLWGLHGMLVFPGRFAESGLHRLASGATLHQELRKLWQGAISANVKRRRSGPESWAGLDAVECAEQLDGTDRAVRAAVLGRRRAEMVGIGNDDAYISRGPLDIGRFSTAEEIGCFKAVTDLARGTIEAGTPIQDIWETRFKPLAQVSEHAVVVDQWVGSELLREQQDSGFVNFLRLLGQVTSVKTLDIYCTPQKGESSQEYLRWFQHYSAVTSPGSPRKITLYISRGKIQGITPHPRWVMLGNVFAVVDKGLSLFSTYMSPQSSTKELATYTALLDEGSLTASEARLRQNSVAHQLRPATTI